MNGNQDLISANWAGLTHLELGKLTEHLAICLLIKEGLEVYKTEVDQKGIDIVASTKEKKFLRIQVKSIFKGNYVYMTDSGFDNSSDDLFCFLFVYKADLPPKPFLIPATAWQNESDLLKVHNYEKKEFGINISQKNMKLLELFDFNKELEKIKSPPNNT